MKYKRLTIIPNISRYLLCLLYDSRILFSSFIAAYPPQEKKYKDSNIFCQNSFGRYCNEISHAAPMEMTNNCFPFFRHQKIRGEERHNKKRFLIYQSGPKNGAFHLPASTIGAVGSSISPPMYIQLASSKLQTLMFNVYLPISPLRTIKNSIAIVFHTKYGRTKVVNLDLIFRL